MSDPARPAPAYGETRTGADRSARPQDDPYSRSERPRQRRAGYALIQMAAGRRDDHGRARQSDDATGIHSVCVPVRAPRRCIPPSDWTTTGLSGFR
jgi:hypothetical protein